MRPLAEGLLDMIKAKSQINKVQSEVTAAYEKLIEDNPKKYTKGEEVLNDVLSFAKSTYSKIVTVEGALPFKEWWKTFASAHINLLNKTTFNVK